MGLNINSARFLLAAHRRGVRFDTALTIGRQQLNLYKPQLRRLLSKAGLLDEDELRAIPDRGSRVYAEPFLRMLGAHDVQSMDLSDYEGATVLHDLNKPVPPDLVERFDVLLDGGTLEHVLNVPTALHTYMSVLRQGGSLFLHVPANNCCGHGFYQMSPDIFFRVLSPLNGFEIRRVVIHAVGPYNRWYEVSDPGKIHSRVELITWRPMYLLVHATKIGETPSSLHAAQQVSYSPDDYERMHENATRRPGDCSEDPRQTWTNRLPAIAQFLRVIKYGVSFYKNQSLHNRDFYNPVSKR